MKMENFLNISNMVEENTIAYSDVELLLQYINSEIERLQNSDIMDSFKKIILVTLFNKVSESMYSRDFSDHYTYAYKGIIPFSTFEFSNYPYIIFLMQESSYKQILHFAYVHNKNMLAKGTYARMFFYKHLESLLILDCLFLCFPL